MDFQPYVKCLNEAITKNDGLNFLWNNLYSTRINRLGKSIYNTEYTESVGAHFADGIMSDTVKVNVPIWLGYSSHFKEKDAVSESLSVKISDLNLDIKFYNYLFKFSKNLILFLLSKFLKIFFPKKA